MKWGIDAVIILLAVIIAAILPVISIGLMAIPAFTAIGYNHGQDGRGPKRLNP
jgi:4-hydroxybenzoate polyprenyltransferase